MNFKRYIPRFLKSRKAVVLMYHRIAEPQADPWQLAVSPANFEGQIRLLREKYNVVTPQQIAKQLKQKSFSSNQICVSFDDGYLDNYAFAKPILEKYRCPATFFISTYFLPAQQPFWWDELQEIIFSSTQLPSPFCVAINGQEINITLDQNGYLTPDQQEKQNGWIWSASPPTERCRLYFSLWEKMRSLPQPEIEPIMTKLKDYIQVRQVEMNSAFPMTIAQLKTMSESPVVQIGLHTHTHPDLSSHPLEFQRTELEENKRLLEKACGYSIRTMSYPHGRYNDDTLKILHDLNIEAAFVSKGEAITSHSIHDRLGRYQVLNWNPDEFDTFLRNILDS